ncbi:beta-ketoacyl synthase [Roseovarius sp. M141]|uniref:beta-ketoacyl-[acyl-carrier-protein] synthase family protein n=1 Tax=Roseovarius sp. M141 TaxID=2583806 RepID=UPI0020CFC6E9|nr:beta-ketoacyl-[acyl-carrier-protein] synthase family protein [Roseovarius sp. M141]MCQ0090821.1 beta-ketoacyl-[acyl-carrier-protein] synthase family protein [Roseovarius sp. M141]
MSQIDLRRPDGSHRVVVTGMGAVTGFGVGLGRYWQGICEGRTAIAPTTRSFEDLEITRPAAVIADYVPEDHFTNTELLIAEPFVQFAQLAAREAVANAGLGAAQLSDAAIILGCGGGGEKSREDVARQLFGKKRPRAHPMTVPRTNHQAVVGIIAIEHQILGPGMVIATGCAAGSHAVAQATMMLRHGYADVALTGGTEANILYSAMRAFDAARTVAPDTCRPFSIGRGGLAFGEGAGVLVIETLTSAQARGANIIAEIAGFGMSSDARDTVQPTLRGPVRAVTLALKDAAMPPGDVAYVSAHGTGTPLNDVVETQVAHAVFGPHAGNLMMSSTKSQIGHTFGAAGALELIATLNGMAQGVVPPTVNHQGPDPECDIDCVPNAARAQPFSAAVSQSFAFGGVNAAIAVRRI